MEEIRYAWDAEAEEWNPSEKTEYTQSGNGNMLSETVSIWDMETSAFSFQTKHEHLYNEDGTPLLFIEFNWELNSGKWVAIRQIEHIHDAFSRLSEQNILTRIDAFDEWHNATRNVIDYDSASNALSYTQFDWSPGNSAWESNNKFEITYDNESNRTEMTSYMWDQGLENFVGTNRYSNSYDESGNNTMGEIYIWDPGAAKWTIRVMYTYDFDKNGNAMAQMLYLQDHSTNSLKVMKRDYYFYSLLEIINEIDTTIVTEIDTTIVSEIDTTIISEIDTTIIAEIDTTIIAEIDSTDVIKGLEDEIRIYPNPAYDLVHISSPIELITEVMDISGRKIMQTRLPQLNVSSLQSGIYILRMSEPNNKYIMSKRLIVR